uniref:GYF domain-containing protein n=1 Tax=Tetradesmus obliquus TaxID=3088 RepID=A0A383W130_TETOB|eukprot:jgi/Sobl393_1/6284/SZX70792.1
MELEVLRSQLQLETSSRKEHEVQCAAKTRQLWQLREQHEREVRRLQDQLSVVRASLLQHLAHKAALELKVKQQQSSNEAAVAAAAALKLKLAGVGEEGAGEDAAGQLQDDVPLVADGSPKRRGKPAQLDQADRPARPDSPIPLLQDACADAEAAVVAADTASDHSALLQQAAAGEPVQQLDTAVAEHDAGCVDAGAKASGVSAGSAAVLLTAAAKLQRLVEQLTQREPAVAADLSLLQWQLTTAFGSMTGAPSRSGEDAQLTDHSSSTSSSNCQDPAVEVPAAAAEEAAAAAVAGASGSEDSSNSNNAGGYLQTPTTPAGSVKLQPADTHPLAEDAPAAAAAAGHPAQHSAAEVAAAARLFSGAATTLQAPSIDWYYLEEGGSVRGPHDAALMIRWFCSFFLEDHLPVAGVLQQADGSSRQPPGTAFQPLHVLLQLVQQGGSYLPHNAMPAGRASASQLLLAMPASPPPRHVLRARQQQQQGDSTLPRCKAGLSNWEDGVDAAAAGGAADAEPALPVSTLSSEPAATPTGRHAASSSAGGSSSWGSGGGFSPAHADACQQQQQDEVQVAAASSSAAGGLSMQQQVAARLRDDAWLEASPMRSGNASPAVGHNSSSSGKIGRLAPGSLAFEARPSSSKLLQDKAAGNGSSSSSKDGGVDSRSKSSSSGGWGIQAVQDALDSVGSAVEGLAMQVAEGLDSLDSMASAAAAGLAADDAAGDNEGVAAEGSSSALDFLSDFPQLVPAAVMSDGAQQRHSAAGQQQQQQRGAAQLAGAGAASKTAASSAKSLSRGLAEQQPALASGAVADMSEFAAEAVRQVRSVVAAAQLPGVWRVESLHQMLRAVSPEPASRAAAAAPGKGGR